MIERAVAFGRDSNLIGILTEPETKVAIAGAPALLMWNVGIQHRVGPYRIQVDIARDLAARGIVSLRFDLSGMGDSEAQQGTQLDRNLAVADAREAISFLEKRRGIRKFIPLGFCSSVDSAHALALEDERVVGACFVEGYAYRIGQYWMRYPARLLNRNRWKRYIAYRLNGQIPIGFRTLVVDPQKEERRAMGSVFARQYPSREQFASDVRQLSGRGVKMLFVFVGGDTDFNHLSQLAETIGEPLLGPHSGVQAEYYADADHTFFRVKDRERAVRRIGEWAASSFHGSGEWPKAAPPPSSVSAIADAGPDADASGTTLEEPLPYAATARQTH
jgi:dienelactone hydrolase